MSEPEPEPWSIDGACYNRAGGRVTFEALARLLADDDYRRVAFDTVGDVEISTVFLGLDPFPVYDERPPLIFETMIFGGRYDGEQWRYATEQEASDGHAAILARVRASENGSGRHDG